MTFASIAGDPRSNDWPTVPGRLPLTESAVQAIAGLSDPGVRNLWITQSYADLAHRLLAVLKTDQTWCSFAIWASNTAGVSIRGEELPKFVEELLLGSDDACDHIVNETNRCAAALRHMGLVELFDRPHLAGLVARAVQQVSGFIANGNNLVYRELAPLFIRFIDMLQSFGAPSTDKVDASLDAIGIPSAKLSPNVRMAFREYSLAAGTTDARMRAQHVLAGNVAAVLHEQQRLQSDIESALDAGLIDFGDDIAGVVRSHVADALLDPVLRHLRNHLSDSLERLWQQIATKLLMTMKVPGQTLHLGKDLPLFPSAETLFPGVLQELTQPTVRALMIAWDPTHGTGVGSAAHDWANLHQRMGYIVNLFRSRQQELTLTTPPFSRADLAWMEQDEMPRRLAVGEPSGLTASTTDLTPADSPGGRSSEAFFAAVPHLVVRNSVVTSVSSSLSVELGCAVDALIGTPLRQLGSPLDDHSLGEFDAGTPELRVRLGSGFADRPVKLRRLAEDGETQWIEVRSLLNEFRMEALLRRSGIGHMLISPAIELQWSLSADGMLPGDDPLSWIELMDPDDMQVLGKAIHDVGRDPNLLREVRHRLNADRTYTMIDRVESAMHDPDLRAVLVRSRLEGAAPIVGDADGPSYSGFTFSDYLTIGVVVASHTGTVLHRNAAAAKLVKARTGQSVLPVEGGSWMLRRIDSDFAERFVKLFNSSCEGESGFVTVPSPIEEGRWLRFSVAPAAASTVVITVEDMTDLARAEQALRSSNSLLAALDAHSEELVIVFDADGATRYSSSSVRRHLGTDAEVSGPDDFVSYVHVADREAVSELRRRALADPTSPSRADLRITVEDASGRWHHATMTNLLADPDVQGLVLTLRDVHERHLLEHELRFRATHDELTTLPDRAGLRTRLDEVVALASVTGQRTGVVFCDIDNFKTINDEYGHHVGDFVLTELASRLRSALRVTDFVGRFGGDEFVVVFPDVADDEHALALAAGVFRECTGPASLGPHRVDISVSMGLAVGAGDGMVVEELLQRADQAMYRSKHAGRGRLTLFAEDVEDSVVVVQ